VHAGRCSMIMFHRVSSRQKDVVCFVFLYTRTARGKVML
jgi:hypothetical protein